MISLPSASVIIPVYNDESNLPRCLDSITAQTHDDFECILVNDGSTDGSGSICDLYSGKDSRIRVFHKDNEGVSGARQYGMERAAGDYIFSVDSDDWIEPGFISDILRRLAVDKVDILFTDFFEENSSGKERYISQNSSVWDTESVTARVLEGKLFSCMWNVVISRNFIQRNHIHFPNDINYGEDSLFIIESLLNSPSAAHQTGAYYHHSFNRGSLTRKNRKSQYAKRLNFLRALSPLLERYGRADLETHNFFPLNDKYEMLASGVFSEEEYQRLFSPSLSVYYRKKSGFRKFALLSMAETKFYFLAKFLAGFIRGVNSSITVHRKK